MLPIALILIGPVGPPRKKVCLMLICLDNGKNDLMAPNRAGMSFLFLLIYTLPTRTFWTTRILILPICIFHLFDPRCSCFQVPIFPGSLISRLPDYQPDCLKHGQQSLRRSSAAAWRMIPTWPSPFWPSTQCETSQHPQIMKLPKTCCQTIQKIWSETGPYGSICVHI